MVLLGAIMARNCEYYISFMADADVGLDSSDYKTHESVVPREQIVRVVTDNLRESGGRTDGRSRNGTPVEWRGKEE